MKIIKFYPYNEETNVFAPRPVLASKALPEWYKKTALPLAKLELL